MPPACDQLPAIQLHLIFDQGGIDIDLAHVVNDHRHPSILPVAKDMIEQGGFPAPRNPDRTVTGSLVSNSPVWSSKVIIVMLYNISNWF